MDNKPKIIIKLARLWLALGVIFFINFLVYMGFLIYSIVSSSSIFSFIFFIMFYMWWLLIIILFLLIFSALSFEQWNSISKLKKWAIKRSYILSFISLLIWSLPIIIFVRVASYAPLSFWDIFPVLLYFTLIVDVYIMIVSRKSSVKEFLKTQ